MSDLYWDDGALDQAKQAFHEVRKSNDVDWAYVTYKGGKGRDAQTIIFGAKGSGGLNELRPHFDEEKNLYCLLKVSDKIDESVTTKFVFIHWLGEKLPFFQKGKITLHIGSVKEVIGQAHIDIQCNTLNEITNEIVMEKVMDFSGSGSRVLDDRGQSTLRTQAKTTIDPNSNQGGKRTSAEEDLVFDQSVLDAIAEVRRDGNPLHWVLAGYADSGSNIINLIGKGEGNVEELKTHLNENIVAFGLVRKTEKIDQSVTVKFCYIRWVGLNIPRMQRAKLPVHFNSAKKVFHPYHIDIQCEKMDEISDSIIENDIAKASGTKINVLENVSESTYSRPNQRTTPNTNTNTSTNITPQPKKEPNPDRTPTRRVNASSSNDPTVKLTDEEVIRQNIQRVRRDDDPANWCLVTYDAPKSNTLIPLGVGEGGIDELVSHLKPDIVAYGLFRGSDQVDLSHTVKFVFIDWRGPNIHFMQRAQLGTHSGFVNQLFHPFHVDIQTSDTHELSMDTLNDKIKHASGTKNYVR